MFSKLKKREGFTLMEVMFTLFIFVIMISVLSGVFISAVSSYEIIKTRNKQISELNFALSYISTTLKNSKNPIQPGLCILLGVNFETFTPQKIRFINKTGKCQEIFLYPVTGNFRRIKTRISTTPNTAQFGAPISLTSNIITSFSFSLIGNQIGAPENLQPKITINITSDIDGIDIPMTVQRTVSRIKLDN